MPDNITPATERTVVVSNRPGVLTIVSLAFNALILLLLLIGIVCHHVRPKPPGPGQEFGRDGGRDGDDGGGRGCMRFHHHEYGDRHRGWGHGRKFDRGGDEDRGQDRGWSRDDDRGGGRGDFHGDRDGRGFGGPGGMKPMMQPPTATELSDHIMQHLTETLGLTDPENSQVRPVIEQQVAQLQKDMEAERQARVKSIDDATAKIRPMLTAEQQKQLDQMKAEEEQKMNPPAQDQPAATADQDKAKGT